MPPKGHLFAQSPKRERLNISNGVGVQPSTIAGASGFVASLVSTSMPLSFVVGVSSDASNGTARVILAAEKQISANRQIAFMAEFMRGWHFNAMLIYYSVRSPTCS